MNSATKTRIVNDMGVLHYFTGNKHVFGVASGRIVIIGEYTTNRGPLHDDHFLALIDSTGTLHSVSSSAVGFEHALRALNNVTGGEVVMGLANQTVCESRVLWPTVIRGRSLFSRIDSVTGIAEFSKEVNTFLRVVVGLPENSIGWGAGKENDHPAEKPTDDE